ncbi:MAG: tetratricopeptide repeat protein, partial [Ferrovibrionaceae bacterium]
TLLDSGMGGAADPAGARRWYGMAAAQGEARARNNLALLLAEGRGGEADLDAARKLLEQAAAQGFAPAFLNLGRLMASASPESRDLVGAVAWLALAADRGDAATAQAAQADRKIVEQAMSDEEKAAVAARVAQLGAKLPS